MSGVPCVQPRLFEHGIHTEDSDVRAHVSVVNQTIYVFPTRSGLEAIERYRPPVRPAFQQGVEGPTAEGWIVKVEWIADLRRLQFKSWDGWSRFNPNASTSQKGALAVECVVETMRLGRFPFWVNATEDQRQDVQIKGTDLLIFCRKRVQVKCDYASGDKPLGTGNLYLQNAERNPLRRH